MSGREAVGGAMMERSTRSEGRRRSARGDLSRHRDGQESDADRRFHGVHTLELCTMSSFSPLTIANVCKTSVPLIAQQQPL